MMLHERIKQQRELKGYTQVGVAKALEVARQTFLDVENGKVEPKVGMVLKLSDMFDCDLHWLITGEHVVRKGLIDQIHEDLDKLNKSIGRL